MKAVFRIRSRIDQKFMFEVLEVSSVSGHQNPGSGSGPHWRKLMDPDLLQRDANSQY